MKKIFKFAIKYICLYFSMLFPRNKKMIIFGAWFGNKYDDNPRYLYEYLLKKRSDLKICWMTSNIDVYNRLVSEKKPVCLSNSLKGAFLSLRAKYICTATGMLDIGEKNIKFLGRAYYINLWHGLPLKKIMYDDEFSNMAKNNLKNKIIDILNYIPYKNYYVVSTSETISKIYESAFRVKKNQIIQLGQPRNDYFFIEHENQYIERFKNKKIILYMPTHRNEGKTPIKLDEIFDLDYLNSWCKKNNYVFLVKKHFYHSKEPIIENSYDSIFEITNEITETQVLLDAADVLISDYSSCYIDYLLLDRPIIFYNYDLEQYQKQDRKLYFDYDSVTPGFKCEKFSEMKKILEKIENGDDEYKKERENVRNLFYSKINQSEISPVLIGAILNLKEVKSKDEYITKSKK